MEKQAMLEALDHAVTWAKTVGEIHLASFRSHNLGIETKSNISDVVTRVDKESEAFLLSQINRTYPTHSVLGEESGEHMSDSEYCWEIDPLDGTNNYSQGLPVFCVSIGLKYCGEEVVGVVYAPYLNELYTAVKGGGAFLNGRSICVSSKTELNESILASGFPYDKATNPANNVDNAAAMIPKLRGFRRMGSAAYDLCCVASSWLDGYWELNLCPWDVCAGVLIVREAGGEIDYFRTDRKISLIAGNSSIVSKIRKVVR